MKKNDIHLKVIFTGNIQKTAVLKNKIYRNKNNFKNADQIRGWLLKIGCHQGIGNEGIKYMHSKLKNLLEKTNMEVVILAEFGSRIGEETKSKPKPMIKINKFQLASYY